MGQKHYYLYIMANHHLTLYIGVTDDLVKRVWQHKQGKVTGFTARYKLKQLVYFEAYETPLEAITREKQLKNWRREWKLQLIRNSNPAYKDLYPTLV